MRLTKKDLDILSILGNNQSESIKLLSKKAGISPTTYHKRIKNMIDKGILISVSAEIYSPSLGLDQVLVFIQAPYRYVRTVEQALDLHPFIRYRVRCLGAINGLYSLFEIPHGSIPLLLEFLEEMAEWGYISGYTFHASLSMWAMSENDFSYYDLESDSWGYDWGEWESAFPKYPDPLRNGESVLHRLDDRDMRILRQLSMNVMLKKKDIAANALVPSHHLSRRMAFYTDHDVISGYRVVLHRDASRLLDTLMFKCRCTINTTEAFAQAVAGLPFQSTLIPIKEGFFLQSSIPSLDLPRIGQILQKKCDDVDVLWSDYDSSMRYWFSHELYDDGRWSSSREIMVDRVLTSLNKITNYKGRLINV